MDPEFYEELAVDALSETLLSDPDVSTRIACCGSLARIRNPRSIPTLGRVLLNDSDPQVRWACVQALVAMKAQAGTPYLASALLCSEEAWLRARIADAIGIINGSGARGGASSTFGSSVTHPQQVPQVTPMASSSSSPADVLLVTVTDVETEAVLQAAKDLTGRDPDPEPLDNLTYYHLGNIGGASVCLTFTEMGGLEAFGAIGDAIRAKSPEAVIMVGIAFGFDPEKQPMGQVLVSRQLLDYDLERVGTAPDGSDSRISRGAKAEATPKILNRFRAGNLQWKAADVEFGLILSGSKLVDSIDFRDQLKRIAEEAIGGEMEGAGLYKAANRHKSKVEWILVKAVCDYADGHKRENKKANQQLAAQNAAQFTLHVINSGGFVDPQ